MKRTLLTIGLAGLLLGLPDTAPAQERGGRNTARARTNNRATRTTGRNRQPSRQPPSNVANGERLRQARSQSQTRRTRTRTRTTDRSAREQRPTVRLHPTVSRAKQKATLDEIIRRIEAEAAQGGTGVVQIDLDLTALMPIERTRRAVRQVFERNGQPDFDLASLPELPGYTNEAYQAWANSPAIRERFPFFSTLSSLRGGGYWGGDLASDVPAPGLGEFVQRVQAAGGTVVFNSGRFSQSQYGPSRTALEKAGLRNINVIEDAGQLDPARINLLIGNPGMNDAGTKEARQAGIKSRLGKTVAVIDDRAANRSAVIRGTGESGVMSVGIAIPGFSHDPVTAQQEHLISTFEQ